MLVGGVRDVVVNLVEGLLQLWRSHSLSDVSVSRV